MRTKKDALSNPSDWIAELKDRGLTPEQKAALTDWLRGSPAAVQELLSLTLISQDLASLPIPTAVLESWVAQAQAAAANPIPFPASAGVPASELAQSGKLRQAAGSSATEAKRLLGRLHVTMFRAALAAAALIAGVIFLYSRLGLYSTGFGEQRTLTLADGSVVTLNTDSQIRIRLSGHLRRIELLKGEGFFRVAHDAARPFIVSARDTVVRAVGTQFDVKIASRDTVVSVVEGRVKVMAGRSEESSVQAEANAPPVTLERGEEAHIGSTEPDSKGRRPLIVKEARASTLHAAAWTQGRLEFDTVPLSDVLEEFRRYRDFDVQIDDGTVRQLKLTGSFDAHDPDSVLAYIATIPGILVEKKNSNTYLIRRR